MFEYHQPDGHFGPLSAAPCRPETLVHALDELKEAYEHYRKDPEFIAEYPEALRRISWGARVRSITPRA